MNIPTWSVTLTRALRPPKDSRGYGPSLISLPPLSVNLRSLSDSPHPGRLEHAPLQKKMIKVSYSQLIDINWPISYSQLIQLLQLLKQFGLTLFDIVQPPKLDCSVLRTSHAQIHRSATQTWPAEIHMFYTFHSLWQTRETRKKTCFFCVFSKIPNTSPFLSN